MRMSPAHLPSSSPTAKPVWRGRLHQWAAIYALGAGTALIALAPNATARLAGAIYALSLALLFTVSATYHRLEWRPAVRAWWRRADHASIFVLIGGTYTPIALLGVGGTTGTHLLVAVWIGVAIGASLTLFVPGAPKWLRALVALAVGWIAVPYLGDVYRALSATQLTLIVLGGLAYSVGAIVYATRRPNPNPQVFGYHEVFHALTLVGAGLHFVAVAFVLRVSGTA
ncbi:MAG: hemolysin III family protein [Gemmatimonadaceae bacterium]|nr:hemolysin III family protein [Gemmatimonadaceae bacterium]